MEGVVILNKCTLKYEGVKGYNVYNYFVNGSETHTHTHTHTDNEQGPRGLLGTKLFCVPPFSLITGSSLHSAWLFLSSNG